MTAPPTVPGGTNSVAEVKAREKLCALLLDVAGRDTNRLPSVIRHMAVLEAAFDYMSPAQQRLARDRIGHLETKWGSGLARGRAEPETTEISSEMLVDRWLAQRRHPERYLGILHRAACVIWDGETSISRIEDHAYAAERDSLLPIVSIDSFREWLFQLRIAYRQAKGIYRPGLLCRWWIMEMDPAKGRASAYAACLKRIGARARF